MNCILRTIYYELFTTNYLLRTIYYELFTKYYLLRTIYYELFTANYLQEIFTMNYLLWTIYYELFTMNYLLRTFYVGPNQTVRDARPVLKDSDLHSLINDARGPSQHNDVHVCYFIEVSVLLYRGRCATL